MARPRLATDDELLEAARTCFLEHGPSVSTSTIAEHAGVSQATLFKRFGTKEELMVAAMLPCGMPSWVEAIARGPDDRPLREQLLEHAVRITRFFDVLVPSLMVVKASGMDHHAMFKRLPQPPPVLARQAVLGWFERARDRGLLPDHADVGAVTTVFLGALQHRSFLAHILGLDAPTDSLEAVLDVVLAGAFGGAP